MTTGLAGAPTIPQQGGRLVFQPDTEVRIFDQQGKVSQEIYLVDAVNPKSFRRGQVALRQKGTGKTLQVNQRRVLPVSIAGHAVVIESGDKYRTICPKCGAVFAVEPSTDTMTCPTDGPFPLHWLGVRPMATEAQAKPKHKPEKQKPAKAAKKPPTPKPAKPKVAPLTVDFKALAALDNCELWTKKQIKFDHSDWDVAAHVLLFTGSHPRKLCFNSYNGTLGKKATALPIDEFVANRKSGGKANWFKVDDLEKMRERLRRQEYELHRR